VSKQRREMLSSDAIALCYQQFAAARLEGPSASPRMGTAPDLSINPILPDDPGSYQKASNRRRSLAGVQEIAPCARLDGGGGSGEKNFARQEREMAIVEDGCQRTTKSLSSFAAPVNLFCKEQSVHLSSKLRRTRSHRKLR